MKKLVVSRLISSVPLLVLLSLFVFGLINLTPTDPAAQILGVGAGEDAKAAYRHQLGLDRPLHEQFGQWVLGALRGDLGKSWFTAQPVTQMIGDRLGVTLSLALLALVLALLAGVPLGILGALRPGSVPDRILTLAVSLGLAVPGFWLALLLALLFALTLRWFPVVGYTPFTEDPGEWARSLVLPATAMAVHTAAVIARQTRGALVDTLNAPYVQALRSRGIPFRRILLRYAMKNAMIPVLAVIAVQMSVLVGVTFVVERIFALPGIGTLLMDGVVQADMPVLQGTVVVVGALVLLINLITDIAYGVVNPKVRPR
ncbi:ABC transporter permease [Microtetraspora niveoalba]|uniref:ABC transporter permease n=1 Tax=Microtetraspora niveoalba TaxID=46175 RepID=UPI00082B0FC9|nr:ABC transporter permease [Microtetraspora niveoalba]